MKGTTTYRSIPLPKELIEERKGKETTPQGPPPYTDGEAAKSLLKMAIANLNQVTPPTGPRATVETKPLSSLKRKRFGFDEIPANGSARSAPVNGEVRSKVSEVVAAVELIRGQEIYSKSTLQNMALNGSICEDACSATSADGDKINGGNWQCWSHEEEVFLVGAVLERFFSRGSLSSTKKENNAQKHNCWETIKKTYDESWRKFSAAMGQKSPPERSENALSRHYKVMKERSIAKSHRSNVDFKTFYDEWENKYNLKYGLIPDGDYSSPSPSASNGEQGPDWKSKSQGQSRGRWNYRDEVILIGVVLETFFQRGSLSSSHRERMKKENDFWQNLHEVFERVKFEINREQGINTTKYSRTAQALARHFKVMKVKLIESRGKLNLKSYYREWEKTFRRHYVNSVESSLRTQGNQLTIDVDHSQHEYQVTQQLNALRYLQAQSSNGNLKFEDPSKLGFSHFSFTNAQGLNSPGPHFNQGSNNSGSPLSTMNAASMLANLGKLQYREGSRNSSNGNTTSASASGEATTPKSLFASSNSLLNQSLLSLNFLNGLPTPRLGSSLPALKTPGGNIQTNGLNTPVAGLDLDKVNELFSPLSAMTPVQNVQTPRTPMFSQMANSPGPQPIVTQSANSTTYWLPLTLYNVDENEKESTGSNGKESNSNSPTNSV